MKKLFTKPNVYAAGGIAAVGGVICAVALGVHLFERWNIHRYREEARQTQQQNLQLILSAYDTDHNGLIEGQELQQLVDNIYVSDHLQNTFGARILEYPLQSKQ